MKPIKLLALSVTMGISASVYSTDYSKCSDFLAGQGNGVGIFAGMDYLPFDLQSDGKIKPHNDVNSYEFDENTNTETIVYSIPGSASEKKGQNPFIQNMRQVKVVIQRNDKGDITSIVNDQNLSPQQIKRMGGGGMGYPPAGIGGGFGGNSSAEASPGSDYTSPQLGGMGIGMIPGGGFGMGPLNLAKSLDFEIKNGECVPAELKETSYHPYNESNYDTTTYKTKLCRDIHEFIEDNPEASACFDSNLNNKMKELFSSHFPESPFGSPGIVGGGMFPGAFNQSLELRVLPHVGLPEGAESPHLDRFQKSTGQSPVILSHQILEDCKSRGLGKFIENDELWKQTTSPYDPANIGESFSTDR